MIELDFVDAVIGLGKNLFYNSSMESCLLVCRMKKPKERKGKIIFIDAKELKCYICNKKVTISQCKC